MYWNHYCYFYWNLKKFGSVARGRAGDPFGTRRNFYSPLCRSFNKLLLYSPFIDRYTCLPLLCLASACNSILRSIWSHRQGGRKRMYHEKLMWLATIFLGQSLLISSTCSSSVILSRLHAQNVRGRHNSDFYVSDEKVAFGKSTGSKSVKWGLGGCKFFTSSIHSGSKESCISRGGWKKLIFVKMKWSIHAYCTDKNILSINVRRLNLIRQTMTIWASQAERKE